VPAPVSELLSEEELQRLDDAYAARHPGARARVRMPAPFRDKPSPLERASTRHRGRGPHSILTASVQLNPALTVEQVHNACCATRALRPVLTFASSRTIFPFPFPVPHSLPTPSHPTPAHRTWRAASGSARSCRARTRPCPTRPSSSRRS
jgi:hypothetical protein